MINNQFTTSNYENNYNLFQLQLPLDVATIIPKDDLVYTFVEILKGVDLTKYVSHHLPHANQRHNPIDVLQTVLFAFVDNKRTLRQIEHACQVDIRYLWLSKETKPSFMTLQRFIKKHLTGTMEDIFYDINTYLREADNMDMTKLYIDETYYSIANKDKKIVNGKQLRGLSSNQSCISIRYDGANVIAKFEGYGKSSQKKTWDAFLTKIEPGSHIYHDKEKSHRILVKKLKLIDHVFDGNEIKKLDDKDNPLEPINRMCYLLTYFLDSHSGFHRNDIPGYLDMFCYIMKPPHSRLKKVENLLIRALGLPKTLKYRDYYSKKSHE
jgi:transposase